MLARTLPYYRAHLVAIGEPSVAYANWQTQAARAVGDAVPVGHALRQETASYAAVLAGHIVASFERGREKLLDSVLSNASSLECLVDAAAAIHAASEFQPRGLVRACNQATAWLLAAQQRHKTGGFGFSLTATEGKDAVQRIDTTGHVANAFTKLLCLEPLLSK